jgi:hypothetical protein
MHRRPLWEDRLTVTLVVNAEGQIVYLRAGLGTPDVLLRQWLRCWAGDDSRDERSTVRYFPASSRPQTGDLLYNHLLVQLLEQRQRLA